MYEIGVEISEIARIFKITEDELKTLNIWDSDQWEIEEVEE